MSVAGEIVALGALRSPDRVAVKMRDGDGPTYRELDVRTNRLANALLARGLRRGDRVAAWMSDCPEYLELYFALAKAGLVMVPVNARFTVEEASYIVADAGARALVYTHDLAGPAGELLERHDAQLAACVGTEFEALIEGAPAAAPAAPAEDDLLIIGYTSGTTGFPKGAMLSHRAVAGTTHVCSVAYRLTPHGAALFTGSMSFVAAVPSVAFSTLYVGGTVVLMGRWDAGTLLDTMESERATFAFLPAPRLVEFADAAERRPQSWRTLNSLFHGGSKALPEHLRRLHGVVGDRLIEGWGSTETGGALMAATTFGDFGGGEADDAFASVGRPTPGTVVDVLDEDGRPLPRDGSVGQLVVRSPGLMSSYWNNETASRRALRDGWYHTGDLGSIDAAGFVYVSDRRSDLIVSGGANVYPSEVERVISGVPGVDEVAVVGVPHERWGQTVVAAVARAPGSAVNADDILAHCRRHLAGYKKPTRIVFVDALPRNASNKVLKTVLRDSIVAADAAEPRPEDDRARP